MKIVIVNGAPGSGKTTFENLCQEEIGTAFCKIYSSIDKVTEIAKVCGWSGQKTPKDRKFLSDLKDLLTNYNDLPLNDILNFVRKWENQLDSFGITSDKCLLMVDIREPEEIEKAKNILGADTLLIRREVHERNISNHADANVENYKYDYYIDNNGTENDLREKAIDFLDLIYY